MNKLTAKYYSGLLTQGIVAIYVLLCVDVSRAENHGVDSSNDITQGFKESAIESQAQWHMWGRSMQYLTIT